MATGDDKPKTFTQQELDRLIEDRLAKERAKYADYADLKAKAAQADKDAEARKTADQKLEERIAAAEKKAADAEAQAQKVEGEALRLRVAADKGLTPAQARRLVGATKEELESDADDLLETFKPAGGGEGEKTRTTGRPAGERPQERLRGGGDPTEKPEETDPAKLAASVPRM